MNRKKVVLLMFVVVVVAGAVAFACTYYDCPDWPDCTQAQACGCREYYEGCYPTMEKDTYGPLQALKLDGPYTSWSKEYVLCYKWRPCVAGGPVFENHRCEPVIQYEVLKAVCIDSGMANIFCTYCDSDGEWHNTGRNDYDCE